MKLTSESNSICQVFFCKVDGQVRMVMTITDHLFIHSLNKHSLGISWVLGLELGIKTRRCLRQDCFIPTASRFKNLNSLQSYHM